MSDGTTPDDLKKNLRAYGQEHLLRFWDRLDDSGRRCLREQIEDLDFSQLDRLKACCLGRDEISVAGGDFQPAAAYGPEPADSDQLRLYREASELGRELISAGRVAAFLVAGGFGTRLGPDGPKGDFPISPVKNRTLFEIFAQTIAAASRKYGAPCPWYVMTSPLNDAATRQCFQRNDYYGLDPSDVFIFPQGTLPTFDLEGKIMLAGMDRIACSPDGHGGSLRAVYKSAALADMKRRGVDLLSYFQVDNPLVNIFDPLFLGLHRLDGSQISSKAIEKIDPLERVGNFCMRDGRVAVIEYSDLPDEVARKRTADGSLVFALASIAIHAIDTSFVERLNLSGFALPLHRALKKVEHIDDHGRMVRPEKPSGIRLESFVFDALPLAERSMILRTERSDEFAPAKNASGTDSPQTARRMMVERAARWLESAGVSVPRQADGSPDCLLEISPLFALHREDLAARAAEIPVINPGDRVCLE